jgi:hypothetical protein
MNEMQGIIVVCVRKLKIAQPSPIPSPNEITKGIGERARLFNVRPGEIRKNLNRFVIGELFGPLRPENYSHFNLQLVKEKKKPNS